MYVNIFNNNNGELNEDFIGPTDFETAEKWLEQFLNVRFDEFGPYEDAVLKENQLSIMLYYLH